MHPEFPLSADILYLNHAARPLATAHHRRGGPFRAGERRPR